MLFGLLSKQEKKRRGNVRLLFLKEEGLFYLESRPENKANHYLLFSGVH